MKFSKRKVIRSALGILGVLCLAWIVMEVRDEEQGSWLVREIVHPGPRFFRVTVDITLDGEPMTISRVVHCKPYVYHRFFKYFRYSTYPERNAITHRLPSGEGLIMVLPIYCGAAVRPQPDGAPPWGAFPDLPDNFIPLFLIADDADNPKVIEGFFSPELLEEGNSRLQFRDIAVTNSPDLGPEYPDEEFAIKLGPSYRAVKRYRDLSVNFYGPFAAVGEQIQWQAVPEIREDLELIEESQALTGHVQLAASRTFNPNPGIYELLDGDIWNAYRSVEDRILKFQNVVPFRFIDGAMQLSPEERGKIVYTRFDHILPGYFEKFKSQGFQYKRIPFRYFNVSFESVRPDTVFYDRANKRLFTISTTSFLGLYPNPTNGEIKQWP